MCANAREPEERTPQLNISLRSRRRRTVVGGAVLALAIGGLAAALPAQASAGPSAAAVPIGGAAASGTSIPITGGSPPRGTGIPIPVGSASPGLTTPTPSPVQVTPVVSDSLNPDGVTAPDAIVTCATSQLTIDGTNNLAIPVGCLKLYNGEWIEITGTFGMQDVKLTMQTDGNLVLTHPEPVIETEGSPGTGGGNPWTTMWSSGTTFAGNSKGPGCLAQFQSNDNLVVSNCDGASIWDSATPSDPNAVLCFDPSLGILTIYDTSTDKILWATSTIDP